MALPEFSMRQLLEAGVHYGHQTARWNPRMGEYIYGDRNGIHILDLTQTVPMLDAALKVVRDGWAGFYFHWYLDPQFLRETVEGLKAMGYEFTPLDGTLN